MISLFALCNVLLSLSLYLKVECQQSNASPYTQIIKRGACNGYNETCSPLWCAASRNAACVDPLNGNLIDAATSSKLQCRTCTQSTLAKCSTSSLNSVMIKSGGLLAAYCTDKYLIIISTGKASHPTGLLQIPHPPGEGGKQYEVACVTRSYHQEVAIYKIPLYPVALETSLPSNNIDLFVDGLYPPGVSGIGLPAAGAAAVTTSGLSMFPLYNNNAEIAHKMCEVDRCSAHAGQGFDYHYHGDPYHPDEGTCMYSAADYPTDYSHPPLIAFALDGFDVYGRHLSIHNLGVNVSLDQCGGHVHIDADGVTVLPYHYHAQVINMTSTVNGKAYTTYTPGVMDCFKGNFSLNEKFFSNPDMQAMEDRPDYELLKPCCGSTEFIQDKGFQMHGQYSLSPTRRPSESPGSATVSPNQEKAPTRQPSKPKPTVSPIALSMMPSAQPTCAPTQKPSMTPSVQPTLAPTIAPSITPSELPTDTPTTTPSVLPTAQPSLSYAPTVTPTTARPTESPSIAPSAIPTISFAPSVTPTLTPTQTPSVAPSVAPSVVPSVAPTEQPTVTPSVSPSHTPSETPSLVPTQVPTTRPTQSPTVTPSVLPSVVPSIRPSMVPTVQPTQAPSYQNKPIVTFSTDISLGGLTTNVLDDAAKESIVTATAQSMNISESYVTFDSYTYTQTSRRTLTQVNANGLRLLSTYTITATTKISIPLINFAADTDATTLYTTLQAELISAVESSSDFITYLTAASAVYGATSTANVVSATVEVGVVEIIDVPTFMPTRVPTSSTPTLNPTKAESSVASFSMGAIIGVAAGGGALAVLLLIGAYCFCCKETKEVENKEAKAMEMAMQKSDSFFSHEVTKSGDINISEI